LSTILINMNFDLMWKASTFLVLLGMSGCYSSVEYPKSFISANSIEFEAFLEECSKRPSPPARTSQKLGNTVVFITYCQPAVKGRKIWGGLVEFNKIWRTGANETTVLSTSTDILVSGDTLLAGNYALYTIPSENSWIVILNKQYDTWGAYNYRESDDVLRFIIETKRTADFTERMRFDIDSLGVVNFAWENLEFDFYLTSL